MSSEKDSYKQIFKATSVFGGVQVFNILISIVKSKVVAVLLGPAGLGIISIFNSAVALIYNCTNFGINVSAVKSIAAVNNPERPENAGKTIAIVQRLVWLTGLFSLIITVLFSNWLSKISFGDNSFTFSFMLIGLSLLALHVSSGQNAILQGLRKIRSIALSSLFGGLFGLLISIPLYYFYRKDGIIPSLVLSSLIGVMISSYFVNREKIVSVKVNVEIVKREGIGMIKLGFLVSLASLFLSASTYLVRLFISNFGDIADVGLYSAGFAIIGTYVGMVFGAMSTDYYPSLSSIASNNDKCTEKVNHQILMAITILAPMLTILLIFIKFAVILLYSVSFLPVIKLIQWATLGVFFQAFSWSICFLFLAKNDSKIYFWNEFIPTIYTVFLNCAFYYHGGLEGLGISFLLSFIFYFVQVYIIAKKRYRFKLDRNIVKICGCQFLICCIAFLVVYFLKTAFVYSIGIPLAVLSIIVSLHTLEKKMGIIHIFKREKI